MFVCVCVCISVCVKFEMVTLKRCVLRRLLLNDLFTHSWHLKTEEASKQTEAINSTRNSMSNIGLYKPQAFLGLVKNTKVLKE